MQRRNRIARFAIAGGLVVSSLSMIDGARAEDVASPSQPVPSTMDSPAPAPDSAARQEKSSEVAPAETAPASSSRVRQVSYTTREEAPIATYQYVADPYGFTAWLNATRAAYGLGPVGYDPNLSSWANTNNSYQNASGLGHFVMGPARRQNSGWGDYASVVQMWMASGAHRAALLDPSISWVGIAGSGAYWTFNAY